jgi:hypothetical protein
MSDNKRKHVHFIDISENKDSSDSDKLLLVINLPSENYVSEQESQKRRMNVPRLSSEYSSTISSSTSAPVNTSTILSSASKQQVQPQRKMIVPRLSSEYSSSSTSTSTSSSTSSSTSVPMSTSNSTSIPIMVMYENLTDIFTESPNYITHAVMPSGNITTMHNVITSSLFLTTFILTLRELNRGTILQQTIVNEIKKTIETLHQQCKDEKNKIKKQVIFKEIKNIIAQFLINHQPLYMKFKSKMISKITPLSTPEVDAINGLLLCKSNHSAI